MKVMSIFGTRPEMIKMWATLKKLDELNFDHIMVHTGQNFTPELRDFFFKDLKLRKPDYELDIDTSRYGPEVAGSTQRPLWVSPRINSASGYSFCINLSDLRITSATCGPSPDLSISSS